MTKEEYIKLVNEIIKVKNSALNLLALTYVTKNAKYKVGDIIKAFDTTILIEKIKTGLRYEGGVPEIHYYGAELKKDLTPKKNGAKQVIHENWEPIKQTHK